MAFMQRFVRFAVVGMIGSWASLSVAAGDGGVEYIKPAGLYDSTVHGYSQATAANASDRIIYTAGQGGGNEKGEYSEDFAEQVDQALANLQLALKAAGADITNVTKVTVYIVNHSMERLEIFEKAMLKMLDGRSAPASTLVPVPALALPVMQFEIDAVAVVGK
ncbi:RidA family protein [Pusillimonas sp.]|uniref:RidA family protein n=1 Tax=Pusillimonas sp. TaxID=3040095 RepID=UPI0037C4FEBD